MACETGIWLNQARKKQTQAFMWAANQHKAIFVIGRNEHPCIALLDTKNERVWTLVAIPHHVQFHRTCCNSFLNLRARDACFNGNGGNSSCFIFKKFHAINQTHNSLLWNASSKPKVLFTEWELIKVKGLYKKWRLMSRITYNCLSKFSHY